MALVNAFGDLNLEATQIELLEQFSSEFSRISEKRWKDTEEVRFDIPLRNATVNLLRNGSIYIGVAPDGSLTSDPVWTVVRVYFNDNTLPFRQRIRTTVAWDDRALGWT